MRVWMITGDKQETAINIGISCGLITDPQHLLVRCRHLLPTTLPCLHSLLCHQHMLHQCRLVQQSKTCDPGSTSWNGSLQWVCPTAP